MVRLIPSVSQNLLLPSDCVKEKHRLPPSTSLGSPSGTADMSTVRGEGAVILAVYLLLTPATGPGGSYPEGSLTYFQNVKQPCKQRPFITRVHFGEWAACFTKP